MAGARDIRAGYSRNSRIVAGAHSTFGDAAGIAEDAQAVGKMGEPPSRQEIIGRGGQKGSLVRSAQPGQRGPPL